jgi:hypothetical protein
MRDIAEGQPIRWADVAIEVTADAVKVRREMEAMFADGGLAVAASSR